MEFIPIMHCVKRGLQSFAVSSKIAKCFQMEKFEQRAKIALGLLDINRWISEQYINVLLQMLFVDWKTRWGTDCLGWAWMYSEGTNNARSDACDRVLPWKQQIRSRSPCQSFMVEYSARSVPYQHHFTPALVLSNLVEVLVKVTSSGTKQNRAKQLSMGNVIFTLKNNHYIR